MSTESNVLLRYAKVVEDYLKEEFLKQGHSLSEAWENSVVSKEEGEAEVGIYATGYGMIVDAGVSADRIPYGGEGTGGGEVISRYIQGLARFWKLRKPGISDKAALRLAFATAEVQKKEGMSTEGSRAYSATGERQHFMLALERLATDYLDNAIFDGLDDLVEAGTDDPKIQYL